MERAFQMTKQVQIWAGGVMPALCAMPFALWRGAVRWWGHRQAIAQLRGMDAERLADIGIPYAQISQAVTKGHLRQR